MTTQERALGKPSFLDALLRVLAQKMVRVGEQFGHRLGLDGIVVSTDLAMSIYEHHPRAVHGNPLRIAAVGCREFEAVMRKLVDRGFWSSEKIPTARLCLQSLCIAAQNFRCVFLRIDAKRDQKYVGFL